MAGFVPVNLSSEVLLYSRDILSSVVEDGGDEENTGEWVTSWCGNGSCERLVCESELVRNEKWYQERDLFQGFW